MHGEKLLVAHDCGFVGSGGFHFGISNLFEISNFELDFGFPDWLRPQAAIGVNKSKSKSKSVWVGEWRIR